MKGLTFNNFELSVEFSNEEINQIDSISKAILKRGIGDNKVTKTDLMVRAGIIETDQPDRDAVKNLNISSGLSMFTNDCFDVGYWGGCGAECRVFIRGDCENNQEISKDEVMRFHYENEALQILSLYGRF
jgi:hypothetical protein